MCKSTAVQGQSFKSDAARRLQFHCSVQLKKMICLQATGNFLFSALAFSCSSLTTPVKIAPPNPLASSPPCTYKVEDAYSTVV